MGILFSLYAIFGLHGAFGNITPRISEKALYIIYTGGLMWGFLFLACDRLYLTRIMLQFTLLFKTVEDIYLHW